MGLRPFRYHAVQRTNGALREEVGVRGMLGLVIAVVVIVVLVIIILRFI